MYILPKKVVTNSYVVTNLALTRINSFINIYVLNCNRKNKNKVILDELVALIAVLFNAHVFM